VSTEGECLDLEPHYARITDIACRTLRRLGVPEASVADATQDALLVLHRRRHEFRGESSLYTWVYGVLLRVASDHRRSRRRASRIFDWWSQPSPEVISSKEPSPFDHYEQRAAAALLQSVLDELPTDVRDAFVLVELEELELAEAALVLGLRLSTCISRLRKGHRLFNAALDRARARLERTKGKP
jgi:RNA polymerase sigma-70 factor, ECF subfamily